MAPIFLSSDLFLFNYYFYKVLCLENLGIAIIVILNPLQQRESFLTGQDCFSTAERASRCCWPYITVSKCNQTCCRELALTKTSVFCSLCLSVLLKIIIYDKPVTIKSPRSLTYALFETCRAVQNECLERALLQIITLT